MMRLARQAGDTIIEVMFATTIFSLLAIGGLSIMNKGTAIAQRALETTLVRQQIDSQVDILRFLNDAYVASGGEIANGSIAEKWKKLSGDYLQNYDKIVISELDLLNNDCPELTNHKSFFVFDTNISLKKLDNSNFSSSPETFSQLRYKDDGTFDKADGIWVEAYKSKMEDTEDQYGIQGSIGYIDFYVRACWHSVGQDVPMVLQTIVRLYEPRS